jgi:hypothetical protein
MKRTLNLKSVGRERILKTGLYIQYGFKQYNPSVSALTYDSNKIATQISYNHLQLVIITKNITDQQKMVIFCEMHS